MTIQDKKMIRQASLFGRLLMSMRSKETAVFFGIVSPAHVSREMAINNKVLPCVVTSRMFSVTEKLKDEIKVVPMKPNQELEQILSKNSTEDILSAAVSLKLDPQSVRLVLKRLTDLKDNSKGFALETDRRFIQLMGLLNKSVSDLSPYALVDSLFYLLQLTKGDHDTIKRLETRVKEMLLRLKFSQLLRVVQIHRASNQTILCRASHEEAMTILEMRWVEITNPKDLVSVLYIAPNDRVNWLSNLEQKTLELSETMNVKDLYRILYLMAKRNRRNVPVIRSLIYHMNKFTLTLSPIQLANLSYACAKLNIYDANIMGKIVEGMLSCEGNQASVDELSTVLRSFGMLQWCDSKLMDGVAERFFAQGDVVPPGSWAALLLTAGCVNYLPSGVVERLPDILSKVEALRESDPRLWLDVAWSATILSQATRSMVSSVLSPDFISAVKGAYASQNPTAAYMKLMNINTIARFSLPGYCGPVLNDSLVEEFAKQLPVRGRSTLTDCLVDTFSNMASLDKYVRTNVRTLSGFVLDAELIVLKSTGELQPFGDKGSSTFGSIGLPDSLNIVAVKLLEFGDLTHGTSIHPTGLHVLQTQCLAAAGYKIVQIPGEEFNMKMTTVQRVKYVNTKIKEAVGLTVPAPQREVVAKSSPSSPAVKAANRKEKEPIVETEYVSTSRLAAMPENKNQLVLPSIKDILDVDSSIESVQMAEKPLKKVNLKAIGTTKEMKGKNASSRSNTKAEKAQKSASQSTAESRSQGTTTVDISKQES